MQRKARAVPRSSAHERDTRSCKGRLYTCDCQRRLFDGENIRRHWKMSTRDRLFFCDAGESSAVESVSFQVKLPDKLIPLRLNVHIVVEVGLLFYFCDSVMNYRVSPNILFHGDHEYCFALLDPEQSTVKRLLGSLTYWTTFYTGPEIHIYSVFLRRKEGRLPATQVITEYIKLVSNNQIEHSIVLKLSGKVNLVDYFSFLTLLFILGKSLKTTNGIMLFITDTVNIGIGPLETETDLS